MEGTKSGFTERKLKQVLLKPPRKLSCHLSWLPLTLQGPISGLWREMETVLHPSLCFPSVQTDQSWSLQTHRNLERGKLMIPGASLGMDLRYSHACWHTMGPGCTQRSHISIDIYFRRTDLPQVYIWGRCFRWTACPSSALQVLGNSSSQHPALTASRSFPLVYSIRGKSQDENGGGGPRFDLVNALHRLWMLHKTLFLMDSSRNQVLTKGQMFLAPIKEMIQNRVDTWHRLTVNKWKNKW